MIEIDLNSYVIEIDWYIDMTEIDWDMDSNILIYAFYLAI